MQVSIKFLGKEKQPLILVDQFLHQAESLVEYACKCKFQESTDYYPGIRTPSPDAYMHLVRKTLGPLICNTFNLRTEKISHSRSFLSIVTTPSNELQPMQCIPHFDGTNTEDIAFLHYLCGAEKGGTSFYCHNTTGYEFVNNARLDHYVSTLNTATRASGVETKYFDGGNSLFTRINSIEAHFNRLIIYKGVSLHSGDISQQYDFDANPRTGRLTVTSFLHSFI